MDPQHKARLVHTLTYKTVTGMSADQGPTLSDASTMAAYIVEERAYLPGADGGVEESFSHRIETEAELTYNYRLWVPGDDTTAPGRTPKRIQPVWGERGTLDFCLTWV